MPRQSNRTIPQHPKAPKRTPAQMDADRVLVENLALEGYTIREIAAELSKVRPYSLSSYTVHKQLQELQAEWREDAKASIDQHVEKMLKELRKQKKELWNAWRRSQRMFESRTTKNSIEGTSVEWKREERDGAVAFQNAISDINGQIRELLGLDKPRKTALTDVEGKESFQPLVVNIAPENLPKARKDNKG